MSWRAVAAKDVRDAGRSRTIWLLVALLSLAFVGYVVAHDYLGEDEFAAVLDGLAGLIAVFLPVVAILLGYKSIAHERESGSLYLSLSFPHSRRDLVAGKVVGRTIVLLAPTLVALVVAGAVGVARYGADGAAAYPWFLFATACYGVAFLAIAIGLSMSTTVDRWITFGALGGYLLLVQLWDNFQTVTLLVLHRFDFDVLLDVPDWALLFRLLKPSESYYRLVRAGFDVERAGRYVGEGAPAFVDWWVALLVLVAWTAGALAVGYRRFANADL